MPYNLPIKGLKTLSLIDYPKHLSLVVYFGGCNFRCPWCHNYELAQNPEKLDTLSFDLLINELKRRIKLNDSVVLTGGEPTLYKDIINLSEEIKKIGYLIKLDTNGYEPDILRELTEKNLVNFVSMDIKSRLTKDKYSKAAGIDVDIDRIIKSINFLLSSQINYEFRTTLIHNYVDQSDVFHIAERIKNATQYILQGANPLYRSFKGPKDSEIEEIINHLKEKGIRAFYRKY